MTRHYLLFALLSVCSTCAWAATRGEPARLSEPATVTVSASPEKVRFAAPNRIARLRLEVLSADGERVFDADSRGSVFDWILADGDGAPVADGTYLCVLTIKDLAGRLNERLALVEIVGGVAQARAAGRGDLTADQVREVGPLEELAADVVEDEEPAAATLMAHDGRDGRIVTTTGALSFRGGDFFAGRDEELMRLSPDGSLALSGALSAAGGIEFADGSVLTSAAGGAEAPNVFLKAAGTGTLNRVSKWLETGGAGTLGDSAITEVGGFVGINAPSPTGNLHIGGGAAEDLFAGMGPNLATGPAFNFGYAGTSFGRGAGFINVRPDAAATPPNPSLRFATANQQRMIVTNTGMVGIGTSAPVANLHVTGAQPPASPDFGTSAPAALVVVGAKGGGAGGTGEAGWGGGVHIEGGAGGDAPLNPGRGGSIRLDPGLGGAASNPGPPGSVILANHWGTVGIGTGAGFNLPRHLLTVGPDELPVVADAQLAVAKFGPAFAIVRNVTTDAEAVVGATADSAVIGAASSHPLHLRTANTDRVTISADGKVGIGTTAPPHRLTIGQAETGVIGAPLIGAYFPGSAFFVLRDTGNDAEGFFGTSSGGINYGSSTNHRVVLSTNGTDRLIVTTGGDAAIKTQGTGLILRATDGPLCYRLTVNNVGALTTTGVACP